MPKVQTLLMGAAVVLVLIAIGACARSCKEGLVGVKLLSKMHRDKKAGCMRLLCETDHAALLAACQELLHQVETGDLKPGTYDFGSDPHPKTSRFPEPIVELRPSCVYVEADRIMVEMMGGLDHFGVDVYVEGFDGTRFAGFKYGDKELVPGLWYYDDGYDENPRYGRKIDALIENCKKDK